MKRHIPNILTIARLVLTVVMLGCLVMMAQSIRNPLQGLSLQWLGATAFVSFVVAAVTDYFDGMLARRWQVTSMMGVILDPIADKVLVCGAILGLLGVNIPGVLIPGAIILFREFAVSALREVLAPRGVKLPVTFLAKTKTTLQLVALGGFLGIVAATAWPKGPDFTTIMPYLTATKWLFWIAALITAWTGMEYALAARKALKAAP
ncbi:MAG: CDP-diacylglycerol--glycerol-3-phosphate 3-phosphatidyltransferase [Alphaproteobacteria bacterium]